MRSDKVTAITFTLGFDEGLSIAEPLRESLQMKIEKANSKSDKGLPIPIATGPDGKPIVMGTSVVGPLRSHLRRYVVRPEVPLRFKTISPWDEDAKPTVEERSATLADLFCGSEPDEIVPRKQLPDGDDSSGEDKQSRALRPSALRVVEVALTGVDRKPAARTAINRRSGAGKASKLFQRDYVGTATAKVVVAVDLAILAEVVREVWPGEATCASKAATLVDDLLVALGAWEPSIGGMSGVGFGRAELTKLRHGTANPINLASLFCATSTVEFYRDLATYKLKGDEQLTLSVKEDDNDLWGLELEFTTTDPLYVSPKSEERPDARANVRVTASTVLGSSWRGVLRSRCEFILRSVGVKACETTDETCGYCPTCDLFGWSAPAATAGKTPGHVGLLRFSQSKIEGSEIEEIPHVAIDRFSGGAADEKLYFHKAYLPGATVELKVEQKDERRPVPVWGRQLLALAIRDLSDGLIGLGSATTRGYGTLTTSESLIDLLPRDGWVDSLIEEYAEKEVLA